MVQRVSNLYDDKNLIASQNLLKFSDGQCVEIICDSRFDFGTSDFTFSFLVCADVIPQSGFKVLMKSNVLAITITQDGTLRITNLNLSTITTLEGLRSNALYRITYIRRGLLLELYVNDHNVNAIDIDNQSFSLFGLPLYLGSGSGFKFEGLIGNFIIAKSSFTETEISYLHRTNLIPISQHPSIILHYPLNQTIGNKAWDVVEQYNYAKAATSTAIHGNLLNYTDDETGVTNSSNQSVWYNIYSKQVEQNGALYCFRQTAGGFSDFRLARVFRNGFTALSTGDNWEFKIKFVLREFSGDAYGGKVSLFSTFASPAYNSPNGYMIGVTGQNGGDENTLSVELWIFAQGQRVLSTGNIVDRIRLGKITQLVMGKVGQNDSDFYLSINGVAFSMHYRTGSLPSPIPVSDIDMTDDFYIAAAGGINNGNNDNFLGNINVLQTSFKINGVELFKHDVACNVTGQTQVKDLTGNGRYLYLQEHVSEGTYGNQFVEGNGLPTRSNALRLIQSHNHYIRVRNFNPTKEKGYTYIIGFALNANRNFNNEYLFAKRNDQNTKAKLLTGNGSKEMQWQIYDPPLFQMGGAVNLTNYDTSKFRYVVYTENSTDWNGLVDGYLQHRASTESLGWDEVDSGDLFIFSDDQDTFVNNGCVDGYVFHISIYKGVLSEKDILNCIHNGLGGNACNELMIDCELYLNFEEIINVKGSFKVKDWSPQNHDVVLGNYTLDEVTSEDPNFKIVATDSLK